MTIKEGAGALERWVTLGKLFYAVIAGALTIACGGSWWLATLQADTRANTARVEKITTAVEKMQQDVAFMKGRMDRRAADGR